MTEDKRAVIFVGVILNVLLLNQPVTSNRKADPGINDNWIVSRVHERFGHPNSSITNREVGRRRSDIFRFGSESSRITTNLYLPARFSSFGRSEERFQFESQRRIFRELYNRQERNRDDPALHERVQRRMMKTDFDNRRYFRFADAQSDKNIRRNTIFLPESRFLDSESTATLTNLKSRDRRIDSRVRDTRNAEFRYRTRELERNANQLRNRGTRLMRTIEADSNRVQSENSQTSSLAYSFLKSSLFQYFPHSIPSLQLYQINDLVASTIAGILLYDIMGAMTQNKAVSAKKEVFGNFVEKIAFAVRKMVAY